MKDLTTPASSVAITANDLSIGAGTFRLDGISFSIPRGVYAAVAGAAGSGKTTLLETIAGLIRPIAGTLTLFDRDARTTPPELRDIGFVPQHGYLFPHRSAEQNVAYGAPNAETVAEVVERLGIRHLLRREVASLSGGERQLIGLGRALARKPALLLLDEPLGAIDYSRRGAVRAALADVHRDWSLTTVHVSHDERDVAGIAGVSFQIDDSRFLADGSP